MLGKTLWRFAAWQPGVSCAIVGTASTGHLRHNAALAGQGPLPAEAVAALRHRFAEIGGDRCGEI